MKKGIKQEEFLVFCKALIADTSLPVFLIMDNSQVHRAKILKAYATVKQRDAHALLPASIFTRTQSLTSGSGRT